jgi:hypothetical protein
VSCSAYWFSKFLLRCLISHWRDTSSATRGIHCRVAGQWIPDIVRPFQSWRKSVQLINMLGHKLYSSAASRLLGLQVRIPPGAWMSVSCESCVLLRRGICNGLITRPEESYCVWWVWVCLWISTMRRPWTTGGCRAMKIRTIFKNMPCEEFLTYIGVF